jgi:uncharacterized DUF497 family protein
MVAVGTADGIPLVVYTDRATPRGLIERRVISARRASTKERIAHEAAIEAKDPEPRPGGR